MAVNLLAASTGRESGTRPSRRLRRGGRVPGVVYGMAGGPVSVSVELADLRTVLSTDAGLNALITLEVDGDPQLSIVKDLQRHPVRREVLHVDFLRIDPDRDVEVEVPLILTGEAKRVTQASGMVDQVLHWVPVRAKPADIPVEVYADVSHLEVGSSLRVGDIGLPDGVEASCDPEAPFAVGLITRSTKEYLRQLKEAEEEAAGEAEIEAEGEDSDDEPAEHSAG